MTEHRCERCHLVMSIVRISDLCGRCHAERILDREFGQRQIDAYFRRRAARGKKAWG